MFGKYVCQKYILIGWCSFAEGMQANRLICYKPAYKNLDGQAGFVGSTPTMENEPFEVQRNKLLINFIPDKKRINRKSVSATEPKHFFDFFTYEYRVSRLKHDIL